MFAASREHLLLCTCLLSLLPSIACREVSTLGTDRNGVSTRRRATSSGGIENDEDERFDLGRGCDNDLRLESVEEGRIRRKETDREGTVEGKRFEDRTVFTEETEKSFSLNGKGKTRKKISRGEKKLEARILRKLERERSDLSSNANSERRGARSVNSTDYYAQRRAVMEKFYARQREIAARYAKERDNVDGSRNASAGYWQGPHTLDVEVDLDKDNRTVERRNEVDRSETETLDSAREKNLLRDITDYSVVPTVRNCTNFPLSGSVPRKSYNKTSRSCNETRQADKESNVDQNGESRFSISSRREVIDSDVDQRWGSCDGSLVYQHNLLLSLKGPSNLDAIFEVAMEGPVCITCVEVLRYNRTRALVSLDSGGRGYEYAKLRLKGYENEGFSYIVKVWGVKKTADDCSRQL